MTANHGSTTRRNIPDVALTADGVYVIADNGVAYPGVGGTSCAAPLWAGFMALINQQAAAGGGLSPVGFINPAVYEIGQSANYSNCFHDITTGNNESPESPTNFVAVAGDDLCTGWGTPTGTNLINALLGAIAVINVQANPSNGGTISGGGFYLSGTNVTVCASANATCYSFANWTLNGTMVSTSACYSFTATNSETLVANFTPLSYYTVTTSSSPSAGGSTSGGGTVACGSNVTVCATPNACDSFVNWTDQNSNVVSTSACYVFTAVTNDTLVANFTPIAYSISTSSSPGGGGSTSGGGTVACGSNVTVCATPNACDNFANWTLNGNVVSTSPCYSFTATGNKTLAAHFAAVSPYTITTTTSPSGGGTTSGGGTVACGSNVTVCAVGQLVLSLRELDTERQRGLCLGLLHVHGGD